MITEPLTSEELKNCATFLTHEDRDNQEIGLGIATAFGFSDMEIICCMLDYWKDWERINTSSQSVDKVTYRKICLGQEIRFTWEPSRFCVHFSFGKNIKLEGRFWLNNAKQRQIDRFKNNALEFIQTAKRKFR